MKKLFYLRKLNSNGQWEYVNKNCDGYVSDYTQGVTFDKIGEAMRATKLVDYHTNTIPKVFAVEV